MNINAIDQLTTDNLLNIARQRAQLEDFGPDHFLLPLGVLVKSMREDAKLSAGGLERQSERIINALVNRLRRQQFIKSHPEVLDEKVNVMAIIVGLPRTGSTMLHRLLAASPNNTAVRWWEAIYPMPFSLDKPSDSEERIEAAKQLVDTINSSAKGFDSIHPLDALAYDEELPLMEQSFISTLPESGMYLPSYGEWIADCDQENAYGELVEYLKILQWQSPERRNQRWILKAPHHLSATDTLLKLFPEALIVNTHRDILKVMPSWYSMVGSLTGADCDEPDIAKAQARHWTRRWKRNADDFMKSRQEQPDRFFDVEYKTLLENPALACEQIYNKAGLPFSQEERDAFTSHLNQNKRDNRPSHKYSLEQFDMKEDELLEEFATYRETFGV